MSPSSSCYIYSKLPRFSLSRFSNCLPSSEDLSTILSKCILEKDHRLTLSLHALLCNHGLDISPFLGNELVYIMSDSGRLRDARRIFNKLPSHHELCWNSLIAGHIKSGKTKCGLQIYESLLEDDSKHPDKTTFVALLKAASKMKDIEKGLQIHAHIARRGLLEKDLVLGSTIVSMYTNFGLMSKAENVFENLLDRNAVSWTALIAGYIDNGDAEAAFQLFERMQCEGLLPDAFTFSCILKACGSLRVLDKGHRLHASIESQGLIENDLALGNGLVDMYARSGAFPMAHQVFHKLGKRNVVSWTSIITAYVESGWSADALYLFEQMKHEGISPDVVTLVCVLKACGSLGAVDKGEEIYFEIENRGLLWKELMLGNSVLDMFAKCGMLINALRVFDRLPIRDVISWNAVIAGYVEHGLGNEAFQCFDYMQLEGISPDASTFVSVLNACGLLQAVDKGIELHSEIQRLGISRKDPGVEHALLHVYIQCDSLAMAREVLDKHVIQTVISWTSLIARYTDEGYEIEALECFECMQQKGLLPNAVTLISALKACSSIGATGLIGEVHSEIERRVLLHDSILATSIVSAYAKCSFLSLALEAFQRIPMRNVVSWNALMMGYMDHGYAKEALKCFEQMQGEGVFPDSVTFTCALNACNRLGDTGKGIALHAEVDRKGLSAVDLVVANTVIDMYMGFGMLTLAQQVFDNLSTRDVVSWTTLISGYAELEHGETAVDCYERMKEDQIPSNALSLACTLKACGDIGASDKVQEVHCEIERKGLLEEDVIVGNILVDSYSKCGLITRAQQVFDGLLVQHMIGWTSLMTGYMQLGDNDTVFSLLDEYLGQGMKPDPVMFLIILNTCSCVGFFDKGQTFFEAMSKDYGIVPTSEHRACMVDVLSHCGYLDHAVMLPEMPASSNPILWHKALNACKSWGNVELGRHVFEKAVHV